MGDNFALAKPDKQMDQGKGNTHCPGHGPGDYEDAHGVTSQPLPGSNSLEVRKDRFTGTCTPLLRFRTN